MSNRKLRGRTVASAAVVAAAVGIAGFAFTASNTVPATKAGDGVGGITGYTISAVDYTLDTTNPRMIDEVRFNLNSTPASTSEIRVQLDSAWYTCTNVAAAVTCDTDTATSSATVESATELRVVVAD